jgi:hypothetical protein
LRPPARKLPCALTAGKPLLPRKPGKVMGRIARFIGPRATTFKSVIRLNNLSKDRKQSMRSVTRKRVRMLLAARAEVVK